MREEGDRLRPVLALHLEEPLAHAIQGRVPAHLLEDVLAALLAAHERLPAPVGVIEEPGGTRAARAEHAARERVVGVPHDLRHAPVLHVREHPATPEAELAEGGDHAVAVRPRVVHAVGVEPPPLGRETRGERGAADGRAANLDELPAGETHVTPSQSAGDKPPRYGAAPAGDKPPRYG